MCTSIVVNDGRKAGNIALPDAVDGNLVLTVVVIGIDFCKLGGRLLIVGTRLLV